LNNKQISGISIQMAYHERGKYNLSKGASKKGVRMAGTPLDDGRIKELFKQALLEVLQERKDLLYDVFAEVVEDLALTKAIREGETTESATKKEVFQNLKG
jgi:hypothetical protein